MLVINQSLVLIRKLCYCTIVLCLMSSFGFSHGDLHDRIVKVSKQIKQHPDSSYLYFKRGKLYYQHEDFEKSLKDLKTAEAMGYSSTDQRLQMVQTYYRLDDFDSSISYANLILAEQAFNVNALKLKGRNLFAQKKFKASALAFEDVITHSKESFPENYMDVAASWQATEDSIGLEKARAALESGIEKLGQIISLYDELIAITIKQNDWPSAIKYQNQVIKFSPRKERPYLKLSDIHLLEKNYTMAYSSLKMAQFHFDRLPLRIKRSAAMIAFQDELKSKELTLLNSINSNPSENEKH